MKTRKLRLILDAAGLSDNAENRKRLDRLLDLAWEWHQLYQRRSKATDAQIEKKLVDAEMALKTLRRSLTLPVRLRAEPMNPETRKRKVEGTDLIFPVHTLCKVLPDALSAVSNARGGPGTRGGARYRGNVKLQELVHRLLAVYENVTGQVAGANDPTVSFVKACLDEFGLRQTKSSVKGYIRRCM